MHISNKKYDRKVQLQSLHQNILTQVFDKKKKQAYNRYTKRTGKLTNADEKRQTKATEPKKCTRFKLKMVINS